MVECDMCEKPILMDDKGLRDRTVLTLNWYDEMSSGRSSYQLVVCLDCREALIRFVKGYHNHKPESSSSIQKEELP